MKINNVNTALTTADDLIRGIEHLKNSIVAKADDFEEIIETLAAAAWLNESYSRRIIITGVGKNSNLATKASESFASLGIPSMYLNTCHYSHGDAGFIGPNDIVVHISRSGKTQEMQFMANHLKTIRPNVVQVLLHCNSTLSNDHQKPFDLVFGVDHIKECDENQLAPTTSTTVLLALLDIIAINLSSRIGFKRQDFYAYHPGGSLGEQLKAEK